MERCKHKRESELDMVNGFSKIRKCDRCYGYTTSCPAYNPEEYKPEVREDGNTNFSRV